MSGDLGTGPYMRGGQRGLPSPWGYGGGQRQGVNDPPAPQQALTWGGGGFCLALAPRPRGAQPQELLAGLHSLLTPGSQAAGSWVVATKEERL